MIDYAVLAHEAAFHAQLQYGVDPIAVSRQFGATYLETQAALSRLDPVAIPAPRPARWTAEEEAFLRDNLGVLSEEEIARQLGRTQAAVKIRWTRQQYEAPSKRSHEMTGQQIARLLGKDIHSIMKLIDSGLLSGRIIPGGRCIRVVEKRVLLRWLLSPSNWIYFQADRIQNPAWRSLVLRRQSEWDDEWWTPGQVAEYHGLQSGSRGVNKAVRLGRLPAVRWGNWWILRSDAIAHRFFAGKGSWSPVDWSPAGDAFLILGYAVGLRIYHLAQLRNENPKRTKYRLTQLTADSQKLLGLIQTYRLPVTVYGPMENGRWGVFADWRHCQRDSGRLRFPSISTAIKRYLDGDPLRRSDKSILVGVLRSWAAYFGYQADSQQLKDLGQRMHHWQPKNTSIRLLDETYCAIQQWCEPFSGGDGDCEAKSNRTTN